MHTTPPSIRPLGLALFALCANAAFAIQYDLVTNSTQIIMGSIPSGVIFDKGSLQTSGTGAVDPFLRLHHGGNNNSEKGFNTSSLENPPDGFSAINGSFTHDLLLSTLATVTRNGVDYFQFNLDLGQSGNNLAPSTNLLLTTFTLSTGNMAAPTYGAISGDPNNLGTRRFDLGGNTVMLADEQSGNGASDVFIFVPKSAFTGVTDTYLYLYAGFGEGLSPATGNPPPVGATNGSFEEFSALVNTPGTPSVPDAGSSAVLLVISFGLMGLAYRKMRV